MSIFHLLLFGPCLVFICAIDQLLHIALFYDLHPHFFLDGGEIIGLPLLIGALEVEKVEEREADQKIAESKNEAFINRFNQIICFGAILVQLKIGLPGQLDECCQDLKNEQKTDPADHETLAPCKVKFSVIK